MKTKVIFRKWKNTGDVIALFPEIPADPEGRLCLAYEHVGQHGGAHPLVVREGTEPATAVEYDALKRELEDIGYVLTTRQRMSGVMRRRRQKEASRIAS